MESFSELFATVCGICRKEISDTAFDLWIACIEPLGFDGTTANLYVRSSFQKRIINEKYMPLLQKAFDEALGYKATIALYSEETAADAATAAARIYGEYVPNVTKDDLEANAKNGEYAYTFDTFIVGSSNKFAHAAAMAVATNLSSNYNPLFIHGPSGLGKTHLLMAICNEVNKNHPDLKILYVQGEEFTNELIEAIRNENTAGFHDKYRSADVLLVDDIQFIAGKESTQEEFFHTFNTLWQAGKQIVLTSDRPPREIRTLEERLRTRFEWGLMADISAPDFETRIAIIRRKAELLDFEIPDDVAQYIANRIKSNIRQLEGAVKKLKAYKLMIGASPSIALAQNAIKDILNDNQPVAITVERIIDEVSRTFGVSSADIRSNRRTAAISNARQVAIYIVREVTQMSMAAIGQEFGGRDHSTIVYANSQVEKQMASDRKYKETIEDIIKNIRN